MHRSAFLSLLCMALALAVDAPAQEIRLELLVGGLQSPLYVTHAGDGSGRLFVIEQVGRIRIVDENGMLLPGNFLDIRSKILAGGERGLLGLAFHPDYANNGRFFVYYTRTGDGATVVSRFAVSAADPFVADPAETILLTVAQPQTNHNGGHLAFGPDGYLYIALGDGGGGGDDEPGHGTIGNGQSTDTLLGKLLRLDVDAGTPYGIPPDNPFVGQAGLDEIYAYGLRNPWRFSFDRATGRLFCADVGQGAREEIDLIENGGNYGWRRMEGTLCFNPSTNCQTGDLILPIAEYAHSGGRCSITGGYVYRGRAYPALTGLYFYGDYCTGEIWTLKEIGLNLWEPRLMLNSPHSISSFGEDEQGELYVCDLSGGTVMSIVGPEPMGVPAWRAY